MDNQILKDKVALITGGSTGIGFAAASLFLRHGAKVVIAGRRQAAGQQAVAQLLKISPHVHFVVADVSKNDKVGQLFSELVSRFDKLDIAFNNAGIEGSFTPIDDSSEENFDRVIAANLKGVWLCCREEIRQFKKQGAGGVIVNTSSWLAKGASAGSGVYSASKAALDGLVRALAIEAAPFGIRANNIQPGYIQTPMFERFFTGPGAEAAKEPFQRHAPIGRFAKPEEIAELVLWLSSPASSFVTGETILADGGLSIGGQRT